MSEIPADMMSKTTSLSRFEDILGSIAFSSILSRAYHGRADLRYISNNIA